MASIPGKVGPGLGWGTDDIWLQALLRMTGRAKGWQQPCWSQWEKAGLTRTKHVALGPTCPDTLSAVYLPLLPTTLESTHDEDIE